MVKVEADQQTSEVQLEGALKSRLQHFRDNAASLTLVGIRRLLEEDLGLEKYALDVHKSFIKQFIDKNLHADDDIDSKKSEGKVAREVSSTVEKDKDLSGVIHTDEAKLEEDSPIKGVLNTTEKDGISEENEISEDMIKKAIQERAEYFSSQSETLTLAGARRYLEEELKLSKNALDPFKKFIRQEIEKVIDTAAASQKERSIIRKSKTGSNSSEERLDSLESENDLENRKDKPRQKSNRRDEGGKLNSEKKRKRIEKKFDISGKKQRKLTKRQEDSDVDDDNGTSGSEDDEPRSTAEKPAKKKEAPSSAYGKHVEQLKSVIKACGMSIAPTVYKKAKMVPDSKREAFLIKELEGILLKEGLSKNPSEKEIKEVRKRKERAKELEGIDTSNIITCSRRRTTNSFLPPPRPKKKEDSSDDVMRTKKDKDDDKDSSKKEENDDKGAKKKEDNDLKDDKKKEVENDDKKKEVKNDDDDDEEEEDDEEEDDEDDDDEEDSQNEEFNNDDEGSD